MAVAMITKLCPGCNRDLPTTEFAKHTGNSTGYQSRCRPCQSEQAKARRAQGKATPRKLCDPVTVEHIWAARGGVKACSVCRQVKARDQFRPTIKHKDGHHTECKSCRNDADKQRRWAKGSLPRDEYIITMRKYAPEDMAENAWRAIEVANAGQAWAWWVDHAPDWWTAERARIQRDLVLAKYAEASHRKRARRWGAPIGKSSALGLARIMWTATRCHWCQCGLTRYGGGKYEPTDATYDHVVPLSKGGEHSLTNIVAACSSCNFRRSPDEWTVAVAA